MELCKTNESPTVSCASVLNKNESDPMGESAKRDQIRTMISYQTVVEIPDSATYQISMTLGN